MRLVTAILCWRAVSGPERFAAWCIIIVAHPAQVTMSRPITSNTAQPNPRNIFVAVLAIWLLQLFFLNSHRLREPLRGSVLRYLLDFVAQLSLRVPTDHGPSACGAKSWDRCRRTVQDAPPSPARRPSVRQGSNVASAGRRRVAALLRSPRD